MSAPAPERHRSTAVPAPSRDRRSGSYGRRSRGGSGSAIGIALALLITLLASGGSVGAFVPAAGTSLASIGSPPAVAASSVFTIDGTDGAQSAIFSTAFGDSVLVAVAEHSSAAVSSVADSLGNPFHPVVPSVSLAGSNDPERLSLFAASNLTHAGPDAIAVGMGSFSWSVVTVLVLSGVGPAPIDTVSASNSSTPGASDSIISGTVHANATDLVLMIAGVRGLSTLTAGAGDVLARAAGLNAGYNSEVSAVLETVQGATPGYRTLTATSSNSWAPWVTVTVSIAPGTPCRFPLCGPSDGIGVAAHTAFAFNALSGHSRAFAAPAGSLVLVSVGFRGTTARVVAVHDGAGDVFQPLQASAIARCCRNELAIWDASDVAPSAAESLTVNLSLAQPTVVTVSVFTGTNATDPISAISPFSWSNYSAVVSNSIAAPPQSPIWMAVAEWGGYRIVSSGVPILNEAQIVVPYRTETGADLAQAGSASAVPVVMGARLAGPTSWIADSVALHPAGPRVPPNVSHVVLIALENHPRYQALASGAYERYLSSTYADATEFYALCHPSAPNYLAMTSGATEQCGSDNYNLYPSINLGDLLERAGLSWANYAESMPVPCDTSDGAEFTVHHVPFVYYSDVATNASRCDSHVVNSQGFNQSVVNGTLPTFSLYTPNLIDDCHDSPIASCDAWLRGFLAPILNATSPAEQSEVAKTVFFVTYDESLPNDTAGVNGTTGGGHLLFVAISPWSLGITFGGAATPYDLLSTIEWLLGLPSTGHYDGTPATPPMEGLFH